MAAKLAAEATEKPTGTAASETDARERSNEKPIEIATSQPLLAQLQPTESVSVPSTDDSVVNGTPAKAAKPVKPSDKPFDQTKTLKTKANQRPHQPTQPGPQSWKRSKMPSESVKKKKRMQNHRTMQSA